MKDRWKLPRRVLGLALALALLVPLGPGMIADSFAANRDKINSLKEDASALASQRKDLQSQIKALQADKSDAMGEKELLEKQINVIRQEIGNINQQITVYDQQIALYDELIAQKGEELARAQADEEAQFDLFCRRMREMEEQGETSYWAILFSSSSFSDLLDNYMMIEEIIQYDNRVIDDLVALQDRVAADKAAFEQAQAEQEEARAEQEEARRRQQAAQNDLKAQEDEVDKLIGKISAQESELKAQDEALRKAANSVDAEIRRLEREMAPQIQNVVSESGFRWPLPAGNNVITSYYGNRIDPFTKTSRNHTGMDLSAGKGTNIYAAKSGVVTTSVLGSGANWAYGNYVVISHSDGTTTLYAHMNSRNVKQGQVVKQGDVIGFVGTTGRSTGYHLHFEVRVNGNRTDPLNYFKDKSPLYYSGKGGKIKIQ